MLNEDAFMLIEQQKENGVTAEFMAKRLGIAVGSAASWLATWKKRGFLKYKPYDKNSDEYLARRRRMVMEVESGASRQKQYSKMGPRGVYILGDREWGSYANGRQEDRIAIREQVGKW